MTGPGSGAPDRDVTADPASRRGMGGRILAVLAIGLIFRLIIAYAIPELRGSGFRQALQAFQFWASNLAEQGPFGF